MSHYHVLVPIKDNDDTPRYRQVGIMFENKNKAGETYFRVKLDFPVGVNEFLCFTPRSDDQPQG